MQHKGDGLIRDIGGIVKQYIFDVINIPPERGNTLDEILQKALVADSYIRSIFATDPQNPCLLDLHLGLIDVFSIASEARRNQGRLIRPGILSSNSYVFPLRQIGRAHV